MKTLLGAGFLALYALSFLFPNLVSPEVHGLILATLPAFGGLASYDMGVSGGVNLDLSQELHSILLADTMFLGRIGSGAPAKNVDHYFLEELLNGTTITFTAALDSSTTSYTSTTGDGAKMRIGSLLVNETEAGVDEVIQVTNISGETITIVRGAGDSAPVGQAHAAGSLFRIIADAKQEGDENTTDASVARTRVHNICQIFKKEVKISGTQQSIDMAGVPNEYQHQLGRRLLELKRQLAMSVWAGVKISNSSVGGSDSIVRSMNGVRNFVRSQSSQLDSTSTAFNEPLVNSLYKKIYDKGGEASVAVGAAEQMTKFSSLHADKVRYAPSERARGVFVTKYLNEYGVELDLLIDRWCLKGDLLIGDPGRVKLVPLQNRAFKATPLAQSGDALIGMIVGEYTLEVFNAPQCFALAKSLAFNA